MKPLPTLPLGRVALALILASSSFLQAQIPEQSAPTSPNAVRPNVPTRQPLGQTPPPPPPAARPAPLPPNGAGGVVGGSGQVVGDVTDEMIVIQYPNTPLPQILLDYEEWTGLKVIRDANVEQATVTIETTGELPKEQAIRYLEASLLLNGYSFVPAGQGMVKILAADAKKPSTEGTPLFLDEASLPETEQVVTYIATLKHLTAEAAVEAIDQVIPRHSYGLVQGVADTNSLVIIENTATLRSILQLLRKLDVAGEPEVERSFLLERSDAEEVATALGEILQADEETSGGVTGGAGGAVGPGGAPAGGGGGITVAGGGGKAPVIIPIARTNRILVIATQDKMDKVERLIEELDAPADLRNFISIRLSYIQVDAMMQVIADAITRGQGEQNGAGGVIGNNSTGNTPSNNTSVNNNNNRFGNSFGNNSFGSGFGSGIGGGGLGGGFGGGSGLGGGAGSTQPLRQNSTPSSVLIGKTLLISDPANNTVFASGPPDHLRVVEEIISELDRRPKQIVISVVIGELNLSDDFQFGLDYLVRGQEIRFNKYSATVGGLLRNNGINFDDIGELTEVADFTDFASGLTALGSISSGVDVLMRTLAGDRRFKVISRPTLVTLNNQPADITSGSSIPVPTTSTNSLASGADGTFGVTSNITFQPIVLGLSVTPLIHNDDELTLQISQQNNEQSGTTTINGNPFPNISQQTLNTTVMVENNSTVLLGGLIREGEEKERTGLPILKDVPVIKHLVSSVRNNKQRRELLVFIQPRIVHGDGDLPANYEDSAGQTPFGDELRRFMDQERQPPEEGVKRSKVGELLHKLVTPAAREPETAANAVGS